VSLDPTIGSEVAKTRPCVVVGRDLVNEYRRTVVVIPLSSSPSPFPPIRVKMRCGERDAVAVVDQIRAVSKERLKERIGSATPEEMRAISQALGQILELDESN
jgi:mRNA interferase MazF